MTFWDSLSVAWQACLEEAWQAYCAGSIPIGAAVTDAEGKVLSRGRNRTREVSGEDGRLYGQTLAHAELNALVCLPIQEQLARHTFILYTTTEPCPLCMGAFYMSSVRTLYYAAREPFAGSTNLLGKTPYLSRKPVRIYGPGRSDLETIVTALFVEFDRFTRGDRPNPVLDAMREALPRGALLGERLFRSGELRQMASRGLPAGEVFNRLGDTENLMF